MGESFAQRTSASAPAQRSWQAGAGMALVLLLLAAVEAGEAAGRVANNALAHGMRKRQGVGQAAQRDPARPPSSPSAAGAAAHPPSCRRCWPAPPASRRWRSSRPAPIGGAARVGRRSGRWGGLAAAAGRSLAGRPASRCAADACQLSMHLHADAAASGAGRQRPGLGGGEGGARHGGSGCRLRVVGSGLQPRCVAFLGCLLTAVLWWCCGNAGAQGAAFCPLQLPGCRAPNRRQFDTGGHSPGHPQAPLLLGAPNF